MVIADGFRDWGVELKCPNCKRWFQATMDEKKGHFVAECWYCEIPLAWGLEQDIAAGKFKGKAVSE
jgi:hypothetical protein